MFGSDIQVGLLPDALKLADEMKAEEQVAASALRHVAGDDMHSSHADDGRHLSQDGPSERSVVVGAQRMRRSCVCACTHIGVGPWES